MNCFQDEASGIEIVAFQKYPTHVLKESEPDEVVSMNAKELELRFLIEDLNRTGGKLPATYFYTGPMDFLLREGRFFEPAPLPGTIARKEIRQCFRNARRVTRAKGFSYVEGFALSMGSSFPHKHAWNIDSLDRVVDTTWIPVGTAYFGVVFSYRDTLRPGSLIDDWENGWPLLLRPFREFKLHKNQQQAQI